VCGLFNDDVSSSGPATASNDEMIVNSIGGCGIICITISTRPRRNRGTLKTFIFDKDRRCRGKDSNERFLNTGKNLCWCFDVSSSKFM
jgi:hypothetical protein